MLTFITSAAQSAARNKPGGSEIAEAKRDVMQSCIRELSLTPRQIETFRQIFGFFDAGKLNLNSLFFNKLGNAASPFRKGPQQQTAMTH